jgi:hypothetical protein
MKELYTWWRHKKTHQVYIIVGQCRLEKTGQAAFLYVRDADAGGTPWAREKEEFLDGRFEQLLGRTS